MTSPQDNKNGNQKLELRFKDMQPQYSSLVNVSYTNEIFLVQFFSGGVCSIRNAITPQTAKRLAKLMTDMVAKYERVHGAIKPHNSNLKDLPSEEDE